jgi:hypothetical protein
VDDVERCSDQPEAEADARVGFDGDGNDVDGTSNGLRGDSVGETSATSSMIPRDTLNMVWHEGLWR